MHRVSPIAVTRKQACLTKNQRTGRLRSLGLGVVLPLAMLLGPVAHASCPNPNVVAGPGIGSDAVVVTPNLGIYAWNAGARAWALIDSFYSETAEVEPMLPGDTYLPPSMFGGGGGGTGPGGGGHLDLAGGDGVAKTLADAKAPPSQDACNDPKEFPQIVVTGTVPSGGGGGISRLAIFRPVSNGGAGGGRSGFARVIESVDSKSQTVSCSDEVDVRQDNARASIGVRAIRGSLFTIKYSNGQREVFLVVNKFSWVGYVPQGTCG